MTRAVPSHFHSRTQRGATLLVAIMMLLIITLLAVSSMRGVSLESRITGNLKQQKTLTSAAEAALRMGEQSIKSWECVPIAGNPNKPCRLAPAIVNGDYPANFTAANNAYLNTVTGYEVQVQWYITDLKLIDGQAQDGCMLSLKPCGQRYYEITACASTVLCTSDTATQRVILRTVFAVSDS